MDKTVIFAVAGSGKTTLIISQLEEGRRALIITYTDNNYTHLRFQIIRKFGYMPVFITLMTYFEFLHGFCYRPFKQLQLQTRGLNFKIPPDFTSKLPRTNIKYYRDGEGRLYHNRLAKLIDQFDVIPQVLDRMERYYDDIYVDEVQDFAGHDFNLLTSLCAAKTRVLFVGDFFQHTFDTSRDGNVNKNLHDDIAKYEKRFKSAGLTVDKITLGQTWRCSKTVCDFIKKNLSIDIDAQDGRTTDIINVELEEQAKTIYLDNNIVKLFYSEHYKYDCFSMNWGASKGLDHFKDVCIVMGNKIWKQYREEKLTEAVPSTRNKLYVACSRARGDIYFMPDKLIRKFKA
ncbi:DEAD/DEAH box helicase [Yersinia proxima]|uniref:AAA family ATPase n=1 Tax=Yersinia proxima TaxID=2890316 RepID=UPI0005E783FD|nr:AAA family ATPase [Yersinia proxima]CNL12916.1 Viral (Superfamily 1) RNA helicase [Yersinia intermedia]